MRTRVRPAYSPEELARVYPHPHTHVGHRDHLLRVKHTYALAEQLMMEAGYAARSFSVADLACGDATIAKLLCDEPILGDFAPGYPVCGRIEETIEHIGWVRLFIFTEIAEHLDDPDKVLRQIREHADCLVLSTPISEDPRTAHAEHYWSWSMEDVRDMLWDAGWKPVVYGSDVMPNAQFQYWGCMHA